jgi:ABC-2 type transport system ATP-binding protein
MDEAQHLADRVAIIVQGRIVATGHPQDLIDTRSAVASIRFVPPGRELPPSIKELITAEGERIQLSTSEPTSVLHELTSWALHQGIELEGLTVTRPNLEDVYLELTGEETRL